MTAYLADRRSWDPATLGRRPGAGGPGGGRRDAGRPAPRRRRGRTRWRPASGRCSATARRDVLPRRRRPRSSPSAATTPGDDDATGRRRRRAGRSRGRRRVGPRPQPPPLPARRGHGRNPRPLGCADARRLQPGPPRPRHGHRDGPGHRDPGQRGRRAGGADPVDARGRRRLHDRGPDRARHGARSSPSTIRACCATSRRRGRRRGRRSIGRPFLIADTYPELPDVRGDEPGVPRRAARDRLRRRSRRLVGPRHGEPARPGNIWRGAGGGRRRADDGGPRPRRRAGGVRPVPAAGPPRRALDGGRLLLLQQRGDRGRGDHALDRRAGRDPRRRLPPRQRDPADLLAPRRRPLRLAPRPPGSAVPVLPRLARRDRRRGGERREPQPAAAGGHRRRRLPRGARPRPRGDRRDARRRRRRLPRVRHVRQRPDRRLRADDGGLPRVRPAGRGARSAARDPPGGRLPPAVARRERAGVAARRRGAPSTSRCRPPGSGRDGSDR